MIEIQSVKHFTYKVSGTIVEVYLFIWVFEMHSFLILSEVSLHVTHICDYKSLYKTAALIKFLNKTTLQPFYNE